jgi:hypothetical protein
MIGCDYTAKNFMDDGQPFHNPVKGRVADNMPGTELGEANYVSAF